VSEHEDLLARHRRVLPDWLALYYEQPIALGRGEGRRVWDVEGNSYLDLFGGILTTISGHGVPEIVDAVKEQADKLLHSSTLYLIESQIELAEKIASLSPIENAKVFFTTSGTEANDAALLMASTFRHSNQILALRNSYHGRSFSAMSVTGNRSWSASSLSPFWVSYVQSGYKLRSPFRDLPDEEFIAACTRDLVDVLDMTTAGDVACMIAEPIQGVGGFATPPDGFFKPMKKVLERSDILFVSDEVQTGWGRTGETFWGIEAHEVVPDLMTFAKGVGNGLAIAGVVARPEIVDSIKANSISTFGGNPIATAGALANLDYLLEHDLQANAKKVGEHFMGALEETTAGYPAVAEVRGKGLMIGIELVHPESGDPDPEAAGRLMEETRRRGVLVGKGGLFGNVIRMSPPLSLTLEEADEGHAAINGALENIG
jgi:4-aminobutyrate aminotransferase